MCVRDAFLACACVYKKGDEGKIIKNKAKGKGKKEIERGMF